MKALIRVTLALAAAVVVHSAAAADKAPDAAQHASAVSAIQAHLKLHAASLDAVESTGSGPRIANPVRAYPPSCLAYPLPDAPNGSPITSFQMGLYTRDDLGNAQVPEVVTVTFWRVPCSSSGNLTPYNVDGGKNAALLMRIARASNLEGHTDIFPTFPLLKSTQNSVTNFVRGAAEPNTFTEDGPFDAPIYQSTTYVLENYADTTDDGLTYFDYDFTVIIDPVIGGFGTSQVTQDIPGYSPSQNPLPNLPIDGYLSSAYYDSAHSGEGLFVEIYDNADHLTRTVFTSWYTYDTLGLPFWLIAQGTLPYGSTTLTDAPVYYFTGGGFAGNFGASATSHTWGTMSFSWSDCDTLNFSFNGSTDPAVFSGGPSGSGARVWHRLSDINGLNCE